MKTQIDHNAIALRAYLIWEEEDRPHGRDLEFWTRAEAEIQETLRLGRKPEAAIATAKPSAARRDPAPPPAAPPLPAIKVAPPMAFPVQSRLRPRGQERNGAKA